MLNIGCHLSTSKGYAAAGRQAVSLGANTFQCFSRNPRGMSAKKISNEDVLRLKSISRENNFTKILFHAPYILNSCSTDPQLRELAARIMSEDIERLEKYFPENLYVFHPGSHGGQGTRAGIAFCAKMLNEVLDSHQTSVVLLETMSGKGTEIGKSFEEIRQLLDSVHYSEKIGVCVDTCHIFSAGYDIKNHLDEVLEKFDKLIGVKKIHAIHLNDSKNPFASNKDNHENIGQGTIGLETIAKIINHPKLKGLPFFLETPGGLERYAIEISMLKSAAE